MSERIPKSSSSTGLPGVPTQSVWAKRFVLLVSVAFTIGTVVNAVAELGAGPSERALVVRSDNSIHNIVGTESDLVRGRFLIPSIVHDFAYGGTIVVPDGALINHGRFRDLAGSRVVIEEYDPNLTDEMLSDLDGLPKIAGVGNLKGSGDFMPFAIVWTRNDPPIPVLRYWIHGETVHLIDDRLFGRASS